MKKIIAFALFVAAVPTAYAQTTGLQIMYSQGTPSNFMTHNIAPDASTDTLQLTTSGIRQTYGAGAWARFGYESLKPFFAQVDLDLLYGRYKYDLTDRNGAIVRTLESPRFGVTLPVQAGVKIWWFRVQAGLVPTLQLPDFPIGKDFSSWWTDMFDNGSIGYTYGAGMDIANRVTLDVRVQNDFAPHRESIFIAGYSRPPYHRFQNNQICIKLGMRLSTEKE